MIYGSQGLEWAVPKRGSRGVGRWVELAGPAGTVQGARLAASAVPNWFNVWLDNLFNVFKWLAPTQSRPVRCGAGTVSQRFGHSGGPAHMTGGQVWVQHCKNLLNNFQVRFRVNKYWIGCDFRKVSPTTYIYSKYKKYTIFEWELRHFSATAYRLVAFCICT